MKRLIGFTAAIGLLAGGTAFAADPIIYEPAPPMVEIPPAFSWEGPYVGLHLGWGWGEQHDDLSEIAVLPADTFNIDGFVGGAHLGHNWQSGNLVFGIEGDIDYTNLDGHETVVDPNDQGFTGTLALRTSWQASLRARLGYAVDTWLLYATGGVAVGRAKLSLERYLEGDFFDSASDSNTHFGWTVGAGVEKAFTPNWTGRAEVRYTDFGGKDYDLGLVGGTVRSDWHQTTVLLGVSYKF